MTPAISPWDADTNTKTLAGPAPAPFSALHQTTSSEDRRRQRAPSATRRCFVARVPRRSVHAPPATQREVDGNRDHGSEGGDSCQPTVPFIPTWCADELAGYRATDEFSLLGEWVITQRDANREMPRQQSRHQGGRSLTRFASLARNPGDLLQ